MRVFLAGATGVIGRQLVPLLLAAGHDVAGMTRSARKAEELSRQGAAAFVCDVYDTEALDQAVSGFAPEVVLHQLTDLPDEQDRIPQFVARNNRIRTVGTRNLLGAARRAGAARFVAQSIAWNAPLAGEAVAEHERLVLDAGGVVLRYGRFHGPGTHFPAGELPPPPRVEIHLAAQRTLDALCAPSGILVIADDCEDFGVAP